MSVYNGEKYLPQAIDSILNQKYQDIEFIIVNDGSTDSSREIILGYKDPRIQLIDNKHNMGLTKSLNRGLEKAKGKFIARMDADDISLPDRFAIQMEIMEGHKVDICGTAMQIIDGNGNIIGRMGPTNVIDPDLPASMLDHSTCLLHPTIMMKRSALEEVGGYNPDIRYAQDVDMWARMALAGKKAIVIPATLVQYRQHSSQTSHVQREKQATYGYGVIKEYISSLLGDKATEYASSLFIFFLIAKPDFAKKQIPNINLSEIFSFRRVFHQRFIHINNSLIGLDKRIANSALHLIKDSHCSSKLRIKMMFMYLFANLSIYYHQGSLIKGIFDVFYKSLGRLYRFAERKYQGYI
jgi:glycosyltransferase involved in cell wall biosynthesis